MAAHAAEQKLLKRTIANRIKNTPSTRDTLIFAYKKQIPRHHQDKNKNKDFLINATLVYRLFKVEILPSLAVFRTFDIFAF